MLVSQQHPIRCFISVRNPSGYKSIRFVEIPNALEIYTFSCNGIWLRFCITLFIVMLRCHFILVFIPMWTSKAYYSTSSIQWTGLWKTVSQERLFPKILSAEYKQDTTKHRAQYAPVYGFKCGVLSHSVLPDTV